MHQRGRLQLTRRGRRIQAVVLVSWGRVDGTDRHDDTSGERGRIPDTPRILWEFHGRIRVSFHDALFSRRFFRGLQHPDQPLLLLAHTRKKLGSVPETPDHPRRDKRRAESHTRRKNLVPPVPQRPASYREPLPSFPGAHR